MPIFETIKSKLGIGSSSGFSGDKAAALKKYKINAATDNVNAVDIKLDYREGSLDGTKYFQHVSGIHPAAILLAGGFDPQKRDEVNFNQIGTKVEAFKLSDRSGLQFRFIFGYLCKGEDDDRPNKTLSTLGIFAAPPPGQPQSKFLYVFRKLGGTKYVSPAGHVNSSSEIMFPDPVTVAQITSVFEFDFSQGPRTKGTRFPWTAPTSGITIGRARSNAFSS